MTRTNVQANRGAQVLVGHLERVAETITTEGVQPIPAGTTHVYAAERSCGCIVGMRSINVEGRDLGALRSTLRAWRDAGLHVQVLPHREADARFDTECEHRQSDLQLDGLLALGEISA